MLLVADRVQEPLSGESRCFVEYCDPAGYLPQTALEETSRYLRATFPDVDALVLRVRGASQLPHPWRPLITYVRYAASDPVTTRPVTTRPFDVTVREARACDDAIVQHWIEAALTTGYACQASGVPGSSDISSVAGAILNTPGRVSLIGLVSGTPTGHATLLDGFDDAAGRDYLDLFDVLVEPHEQRRVVQAALVAAAVERSRAAGRPLIGNVTHALHGPDEPNGQRVLAGLTSGGWQIDHADWWLRLL